MSSTDTPLIPATKVVRGVIVPELFTTKNVEQAMDFVPDSGDVVLATYPKSGTNWTAQILYLLNNKGVPPKTAKDYMTNTPFLELLGSGVMKTKSPPRYCMTHLDYKHVPFSPEAKYICVIRNPKDALVSLFHFMQSDGFKFQGGSFDVVFDLFVEGKTLYNDYFDHVLSWYEHRNDGNVLVLYYEQMKKQIRTSISKLAKFLGPSFEDLVKDEAFLEDIVLYSSFDYMKNTTNDFFRVSVAQRRKMMEPSKMDKATAPITEPNDGNSHVLVRKGIIGDWRSVLSTKQSEILDQLIEKRLKGTEMYEYWKSNGCI